MKLWLLLFLTIVAMSLGPVSARAQIPSFVRPGLVVTYSGTVNALQQPKDVPASQQITVNAVASKTVNNVTSTTISGTTVMNTFLSYDTQHGIISVQNGSVTVLWNCTDNRVCSANPAQYGAITQFWVDPTSPAGSIPPPQDPKGHPYTTVTCPSEVVVSNLCLESKGDPTQAGPPTVDVLLAFDTTGLIRYSDQLFEPFGTYSGKVGLFKYTLQNTIPWQVDGSSIVLQNDSGQVAIWGMKHATIVGGGSPGDPGPSWRVVGTGDFYGNKLLDILLQYPSGELVVWETDGANMIGSGNALFNPGPGWQVVSVADSEILFQNSNGAVALSAINGKALMSIANPGTSWHVVGTGDFNGDNDPDILLQDNSGEVAIWYMNGTTIVGGDSPANPGPSWHVMGVGDFYRRGFLSDILLQNDSGEVAIWEMKGTTISDGGSPGNPGPSWHVKGVGDFYGHGFFSDILLQNDSGEVAIWDMNAATISDGGSPGNPGPSWHL
jgi:hypothetical protein